jgi:cobalt-zinc-cadmium efflux system outer membrane protein
VSLSTVVLLAVIILPGAKSQQDTSAAPASVPVRQATYSVGNQAADSGATEAPPQTLTLQQALALAEKNNPLLSEASAQVDRSKAGIQTASAYPNPTFEFLAGPQRGRPIATPGVPGLLLHYSATQPVEIPSERQIRIQASRLGLSSTKYFEAGTRLSVVADVKHAFYDVLRRKEEVDHARENLALVDDLRRRVAVQVKVGEAGRLELTRAEAELARARALVTVAQVNLAKSQASLRAVIGVQTQANFDPQGDLESRIQLPPLSRLRTQVLAAHPALEEAKMQTAQAQVLVADQRARRIPQPSLYGEYEQQPDLTFYRFGVSIPLPIWDRRKGPIAEAKAEVTRAQAASKRRQVEIIAALERSYDEYELMDRQVESLQAGSLYEAEAAVRAAQAAYKFGERGIIEVLDAQRVRQGVRGDLLDAMYGRQSALVDLEELGAVRLGGK